MTLSYIKSTDSSLQQIVSPRKFLQISKTNKHAIKNAFFIPPRIGSKGFGKFLIEYYYVPTKSSRQLEPTKKAGTRR